jgi:hypothetical protein
MASLTGNPQGMNEARARAVATLAARCDMSESERADVTRQLVNARNLELTDNPDLNVTFALLKAKTPGERSTAVAAILQNGDPFVMRSILTPQTASDPSSDGQSRIYFQNQWYQESQDIEKIDAAYDLAMCQMGVDCGPDSAAVLMLCTDKGWCGDSVQDAIRQQMNGQNSGKFDDVSALASQILQQIAAGNAAAFVHI